MEQKRRGPQALNPSAGICLTFDDWFTAGWHGARDIFDAHSARATFFVGKPHEIDNAGWERLRDLQNDGHEIGCHTLTHPRLSKFLQDGTFADYIAQEILPALAILRDEGMEVTSFSYPYFKYLPQLTGLLLEHFQMVREAGVQSVPVHATFPITGNAIVNLMGSLDRTGKGYGLDYYENRFDLLAAHGGYGVFCGHSLGQARPKNPKMRCSYAHLEEILSAATARELALRPLRQIGFRAWGTRQAVA